MSAAPPGSPSGPPAELGWVSDELGEEFPALRLVHLSVDLGAPADSPRLKRRLLGLEDYFDGQYARNLRTRPITAAYRVFYRQVGLDPDVQPTPVERTVLERLAYGSFSSQGFVRDALAIAGIETEIPVGAIDGAAVLGPLGLSTAREGEALEPPAGSRAKPVPLTPGSLVLADAVRPLAVATDERGTPLAPGRDTTAVALYALVVPSVPVAVVTEALWVAAQLLGAPE